MNIYSIGGLGGSGTRLIAQVTREFGCEIGRDLNHANDNLWFTLLFKRLSILQASAQEIDRLWKIFVKGMTRGACFDRSEINVLNELSKEDRPGHDVEWLRERVDSLLKVEPISDRSLSWAWKEPNTHVVIDQLFAIEPKLKYIHVVRNGLDMAYSNNQNQAMLWGEAYTHKAFELTPKYSLMFWRAVQTKMEFVSKVMKSNFLFLSFDELCSNSKQESKRLLEFLDVSATAENISKVVELVDKPKSIGRFKRHGLGHFRSEDVDYVSQLGFDVSL